MTIPWHRMFALSKFIQSALATKWHNCAKVTRFQEIRLRASFYYYLTDPPCGIFKLGVGWCHYMHYSYTKIRTY